MRWCSPGKHLPLQSYIRGVAVIGIFEKITPKNPNERPINLLFEYGHRRVVKLLHAAWVKSI